MKTAVKHIPERGCHNCRLHYVDHKKCASDVPCKQGTEWRPMKDEIEDKKGKIYFDPFNDE